MDSSISSNIEPQGIDPDDLSQDIQDKLAIKNSDKQEQLIKFLKFYLIGLFSLLLIVLIITLFKEIPQGIFAVIGVVITSAFTAFASLAGMVYQSVFGIINSDT